MFKFVHAKPVSKIHHTKVVVGDTRVSKASRMTSRKRRLSLKVLWTIFIIFTLIYGGFLLFQNTLFAQSYVITKVQYAVSSVKKYDNPALYKAIADQIKKENYHIVKLNKGSILTKLQEAYPFIQSIDIIFVQDNVVKVTLSFKEPDFILRNQDKRFGVFGSTTLPLYSGSTLGKTWLILDLPGYMSGWAYMTGLFYRQPATGLYQQIQLMYQAFPKLERLEYLPWGERSIIYLAGKRLYINNLGDILQQINNYQLLKKYYTDFARLTEIDLWSLEKDKIIVKK